MRQLWGANYFYLNTPIFAFCLYLAESLTFISQQKTRKWDC
jgi:hypothetical protein